MNKDLISVIVPIYNVEKYLDRCIRSIVVQTYTNIEIILVDDGSTDKSGILADQWKSKDERIIVLHKKNGGLSDARNYGLKYARGEYLSFIDSDDCVDKKFIETLFMLIEENSVEISAVGFQCFTTEKDPVKIEFDAMDFEVVDKELSISYLFTNDKYANYAWNKLYHKEIFYNIEYPVGKKMEDLGTTYKLFEKSSRVAYNPAKLYFYFQREDSILHKRDVQFYKDKYVLSRQRYIELKKNHPTLIENYSFFFGVVLETYPYLSSFEKKEAKQEVKEVWVKLKGHFNLKDRMKYYTIKYFPNVYSKVQDAINMTHKL